MRPHSTSPRPGRRQATPPSRREPGGWTAAAPAMLRSPERSPGGAPPRLRLGASAGIVAVYRRQDRGKARQSACWSNRKNSPETSELSTSLRSAADGILPLRQFPLQPTAERRGLFRQPRHALDDFRGSVCRRGAATAGPPSSLVPSPDAPGTSGTLLVSVFGRPRNPQGSLAAGQSAQHAKPFDCRPQPLGKIPDPRLRPHRAAKSSGVGRGAGQKAFPQLPQALVNARDCRGTSSSLAAAAALPPIAGPRFPPPSPPARVARGRNEREAGTSPPGPARRISGNP